MCRHLAYLGRPIALERLLFDAPHALVEQAATPRHQTATPDNPDGWGVAWYPTGSTEPHRYRTATPMWDDVTFVAANGSTTSATLVAAVRAASPGSVIDEHGNAPFVAGRWSFSLNGSVSGFHDGVGADLRAELSNERADALSGDTDSEVLLGLVLERLERGEPTADAVAGVATDVHARAGGRLNLLMSDGDRVFATALGNSLFTRAVRDTFVVASEPTGDEAGWERVPDRSLVVGTAAGGAVASL